MNNLPQYRPYNDSEDHRGPSEMSEKEKFEERRFRSLTIYQQHALRSRGKALLDGDGRPCWE
jgi:hypothetical protein